MLERGASFLGIFVLLALGYALSTSRRHVPWRLVAVGTLLQAYLALFIVRPAWVPVVLTAASGLCAVVLAAGSLRPLPGFWLPASRGLGLLGVLTALIHLADRHEAWWLLAGLLPLPFLRGRATTAAALLGCLAVVACVWLADLPHDFVFRALAGMGSAVTWLVGFALDGADTVFGGLRTQAGYVFAIEVGSIILVFGGLLAALYYVGVLPWVVGALARLLHRTLGVSGAESLAVAANVFMGQAEAPLVVRPYLPRMTRSEVMALMTGGFATIAGSVLGAYVQMFERVGFQRGAADLIAASVMSAPAAFVFAKLLVPETETPETRAGASLSRHDVGVNLLDALAGGVTAALRLAVNVVAMLLVFYALIYVLDAAVGAVVREVFGRGDVTFPDLYGYLFFPFAFLMGVPWSECHLVGQLVGTKTLFNEFIAYDRLTALVREGALSTRAVVLSTYALCGFANFMSIGIQIGGLGQLAPERRPDFSRLALRAMVAGALACQLTACIVGVIGDL